MNEELHGNTKTEGTSAAARVRVLLQMKQLHGEASPSAELF